MRNKIIMVYYIIIGLLGMLVFVGNKCNKNENVSISVNDIATKNENDESTKTRLREYKKSTELVDKYIKENTKITPILKKYIDNEKLYYKQNRNDLIKVKTESLLIDLATKYNIPKSIKYDRQHILTELSRVDFNENTLLIANYDKFRRIKRFYFMGEKECKLECDLANYEIAMLGKNMRKILIVYSGIESVTNDYIYTDDKKSLIKVLDIGGWDATQDFIDLDDDGVSEIIVNKRLRYIDNYAIYGDYVVYCNIVYKWENNAFVIAGEKIQRAIRDSQ